MSTQTSDNNKRIAKNTLLLYFRMFFMMAVSLYTSRVILRTLGVEDYGIYNVVGGFVTMFGFLNTALSAATQRYITFSLGKGNNEELLKVFSSCILTHAFIAFLVLLFAETVGLWFFYNKLVIPMERMDAAFWVFQCSIFSTIVLIMSVPYNADIIAHEAMSAFAYISIIEVILKLAIVYLLAISSIDKLVLYAFLLLVVQLTIRMIYTIYCKKHFQESVLHLTWDVKLFKEMIAFASWNLWGGVSNMLYTQGLNILLNLFFGPIVNAARGITVQVQNAVSQFANSFQMAINPQITKKYAQGDLGEMYKLIYRSSKFTFILLFIISLPVFCETEFILRIWLNTVPNYTVIFTRLMLCIVILDSIANPLMVSTAATGNVRKYQSIIGGTMILIVPISYLFLCIFNHPEIVYVVHIFFCVITFAIRLLIIRPMIQLNIHDYIKKSILPIICILVASEVSMTIISIFLPQNMIWHLCNIILAIFFASFYSFILGLTTEEKSIVYNKALSILKRNKNEY